ncbi:MAG TPA: hypothetical protein VM434_04965 [Beijerinckiaceae bacterium]|nr:hypothetical protein [Beijerinckiaceae bacterium]
MRPLSPHNRWWAAGLAALFLVSASLSIYGLRPPAGTLVAEQSVQPS